MVDGRRCTYKPPTETPNSYCRAHGRWNFSAVVCWCSSKASWRGLVPGERLVKPLINTGFWSWWAFYTQELELGLFSLNNKESVKKGGCKEVRLFSVVPHRTRGNRHKLKHRRFPLNLREHFFTRSTSTGFPERLWSLHPWRYSKPVWTWSWTTGSRWPCLIKGVGPDDLQRSLPTSVSLWFCAYSLIWAISLFQWRL